MNIAIALHQVRTTLGRDRLLYANENPRYQKAVDLLADLLLDYLVQQRLKQEKAFAGQQEDLDVLEKDDQSNDSHNACAPEVNECRTKSAA